MDYISSKNIFYLMRDTLKLIDARVMSHGSRVAFIVYKMLQHKGGMEDFEMADLAMIATFHDIGVYKTDDPGDMLRYEAKEFIPHSIYGYLFLKYLSPFERESRALLYHHTDYVRLAKLEPDIKELASFINIAEKMDIYHNAMGSKFDYMMFHKYSGNKFSKEGLELFYQAVKEDDVLTKLKEGTYKDELDTLFENLIFSNEDKRKLIQMLMYCIGFSSENYAVGSNECACICVELGKKFMLTEEEQEILYYAALLHDIGMLTVPKEMINAPRKLTEEEMKILRGHVQKTESLLRGRMKDEIVNLAISHHERSDGTGYPKHTTGEQQSRVQRILQVADKVSSMSLEWSFRPARSKKEITDHISQKAAKNKLNVQVTNTMVTFYDAIMGKAQAQVAEAMTMYKKLNDDYKQISMQFIK